MKSRYQAQSGVRDVADRSHFDGQLRKSVTQRERLDAYLDAPTVQSHAAMLERLHGGDLGLVWFGGTQEGVGDISIWFARIADEAAEWSVPHRLTDDPARSEQNPVLFAAPTGELWLLYTAQTAGNQDTAEVRRRISLDDGATWGDVETLFPASESGGLFVRQPVVVTATGRWLLPIFRCPKVAGRKWTGDYDTSSVMISDDTGSSWREVEVPDSAGRVHMSIVVLGDGVLHALFRSRSADWIYESRSTDDGDTWSVPVPTSLPNNNSSLQHRALADGTLALIYNHSSRADATARRASLYDEIDDEGVIGDARAASPERSPAKVVGREGDISPDETEGRAFWGAPRAPLTLAISADGGGTWEIMGDLDQGDGYCLSNNSRDGLNREFSYPALSERRDGRLDLAYTYFRQTIKHVRVARSWSGPGT